MLLAMTTQIPTRTNAKLPRRRRAEDQREGFQLLLAIVAVMWVVEVINSLDNQRLDSDGIVARSVSHLWGIVTSPFLHASFTHLLDNTIPFVFMGLIIALRGAVRLALVTGIVIVIGGLGTWLIAPAHSVTVGASGLVFGYATYLLVRGLFDRSALELVTGVIVGAVWGGALLSSLVPHNGVSWQAHASGAVAGVIAAWLLARRREERLPTPRVPGRPAGSLAK
jgi:membrane associated rhomboid family serine protease